MRANGIIHLSLVVLANGGGATTDQEDLATALLVAALNLCIAATLKLPSWLYHTSTDRIPLTHPRFLSVDSHLY